MCITLAACIAEPTVVADDITPAAFASPTASPRPTETATQTATQTITPSPTATIIPSPTITPTDVPALSPSMLPDSVETDFFLGGNSPECQLPCWNGLIIGESGQEDIQTVFDEVLGLNGIVDLFSEPPASYVPDAYYATEGFDVVGYRWSGPGYFKMLLYVEEESHVLRGMKFRWARTGAFDPHISLRTILRELGPPSQLLMNLSPTQDESYGILDSAVVYEEGVAFLLLTGLDVDPETRLADYCLGEEIGPIAAFISEPLRDGFRDMTPLQEGILGSISNDDRLEPSEDEIGLTAEELTALAMQDEDVCLTIEVEP